MHHASSRQLARNCQDSGDVNNANGMHRAVLRTCFHEQVARQAELLQLAVQLAAPAGEQEAAEPPGAVLDHPVNGGSGLACGERSSTV